MKIFSFLLILSFTHPGLVAEEPSAAPCRCCLLNRVYAPYLKDLPPPKKRDKIGNSSLKITTDSKEAQKWFNQGLNLLHAFWEFEAYRAFLQAAEADPECAMAYWGIGMSLPGKNPEALFERKIALENALKFSKNASKSEQYYIRSLEALIKSGPTKAREIMRECLEAYPADPEAAAFLSYWSRDGYDEQGKPRPGSQEGLEVFSRAIKRNPNHAGLHHYRIHLMEPGPDFAEALDSALLLPELCSNAPHLVHMPGHIFYLQGDYHRAVQIFQLSRRVEEAYLTAEKVPAIDSPNYLHNLHFLAYAAMESGEIDVALEAAATFASCQIPTDRHQAIGSAQAKYLAQQVTALVHARLGDYEEALELIKPETLHAHAAPRLFLEGFKCYFELRAMLAQSEPAPRTDILKAKIKFRSIIQQYQRNKPIINSVAVAMPYETSRVTLHLLSAELDPFVESAEASDESLAFTMELAAEKQKGLSYIEPPFLPWCLEEQFAGLWLERGNKTKAAQWYRKALVNRPKSGLALLGLARATGEKHDYSAFLKAWEHADGNRPELAEARAAIAE